MNKKGIGLGALAVFALVGCSTGAPKEEATPMNLMSASELITLDTSNMLDFPDTITHTAAFEGLYALDENDEPLTAHDFEAAWKKMINPKNALIYSFLLIDTVENAAAISVGEKEVDELGVKALDDQTLEVHLSEAKPYFTSLLTFPTFFPQNQTTLKEFGDNYGKNSESIVYNGPFIVENWSQSETSWDLVKNDKYWDKANVKAENIHYDVIKEASTAWNLFNDGQLDVATLNGELAKHNLNNEDFHSYPTATMNYIRMNQVCEDKDTPLKNNNFFIFFFLLVFPRLKMFFQNNKKSP